MPYDEAGKLIHARQGCEPKLREWNLQTGAKIKVNGGPGHGFMGVVRGKTDDGHYRIALPCIREGSPDHGKGNVLYLLGSWWVREAVEGLAPALPVVSL